MPTPVSLLHERVNPAMREASIRVFQHADPFLAVGRRQRSFLEGLDVAVEGAAGPGLLLAHACEPLLDLIPALRLRDIGVRKRLRDQP